MIVAAMLTIATAVFRLEFNSTPQAREAAEETFDRFAP
jgi:hypothetical protein